MHQDELFDYIISGQHAYDRLLSECESILAKVVPLWKYGKPLPASLLAWPSEVIQDDSGKIINDRVWFPLKTQDAPFEMIKQLVLRVKAVAVFVFEDKDNGPSAILECPRGTRRWHWGIEWHGDVATLSKCKIEDNKHSLGILWRPGQTSS